MRFKGCIIECQYLVSKLFTMDKRLQIDFGERAYDELEELERRLEAPSKSEVIRTSLGVLRWLVDESEADTDVLLQKSDGSTTRVVFHFLARLRPTKPAHTSTSKAKRKSTDKR
jgi:hypothetical protein